MNILVVNDDGINAEGIHRLAGALQAKGDVYVFAPDRQRSASSHGLSLHDVITVTPVHFEEAKGAWQVSGTPADCAKLGIDILRREGLEPDILYSGINHGANLGADTLYSGTVSSAAEGIFAGIPSVAVSVCDHMPKYFAMACSMAVSAFEPALKLKSTHSLISINTPNLPKDEIRGVRAARIGNLTYNEWFEKATDEKNGAAGYRYAGTQENRSTPVCGTGWDEDCGNGAAGAEEYEADIELIRSGYAAISMLKYDLNDYSCLEIIKKWEKENDRRD